MVRRNTLLALLLATSTLLAAPRAQAQETVNNFLGLNLGVGLAFTRDFSQSKRRVESASVVNGVVRIEEERDAMARVVLESHYFFEPDSAFFIGNVSPKNWGHGPFLAIQPGDKETINAIGFGWMWGFKKGDTTIKTTDAKGNEITKTTSPRESWNVGLGILIDPNARVLGDGLEPNQPLPAGETAIRYKTESETSLILIFSFTF